MPEERVKMIWDFRGPNAGKIAKHHSIHLKEFATIEKLSDVLVGDEQLSEMHAIAFMVVDQKLVSDLRARLKPNRGQRYQS